MEQELYDLIEEVSTLDPDYIQILVIAIVLAIIVAVGAILHFVLHKIVLNQILKKTENKPNSLGYLITSNKFFHRLALLLQGFVLNLQALFWLKNDSLAQEIIVLASNVWCLFFMMLALFSMLDIVQLFTRRFPRLDKLPIRGITQGIKLITVIIFGILILSILIGKSPVILMSGLGAMTAILMLVFKDPILGLVAGIQLSANNMLNVGDWLEMPKYDADGAVIDISLTTVKVQNWDMTVTTIPAYALISDSFKNWQGMINSGGRRIKRSLSIDAQSIRFLTDQEIEELKKSKLIEPHISSKLQELNQYNLENSEDSSTPLNHRRLTNIGTFRAYVKAYLEANKHIHKGMTLMTRQLAPTNEGVPLEIYAFTNTTAWVEYEQIQSDIFDHLFAILPYFNLRMHQSPTGFDVRDAGKQLSEHFLTMKHRDSLH